MGESIEKSGGEEGDQKEAVRQGILKGMWPVKLQHLKNFLRI